MDRFDVPEDVKHLMFVAMDKGVIDAYDLYALAAKHGNAWKSFVNEVVEVAYANIHSDADKHAAIVKAAEEVWKRLY